MTMQRMRFQPRDVALLTELGLVGMLDSQTVRQRHFMADKTGKACLRRLALYARHGLVQSIVPSVSFGLPRGGRFPAIHALTLRGAELLTELTGESAARILKNNPKPETILHRLGCAKLHLVLHDACRLERIPAPQWIGEYDPMPLAGLRATFSERFILCNAYRESDGTKHTCWPDAAALVEIPNDSPDRSNFSRPLILLFEYDRSTETLKQFARKLPGYRWFLSRSDWRKFWPTVVKPTVRIFVIVQSMERLQSIADAIRDLPSADMIRLTCINDLRPETFFVSPIWHTVNGEARSILKSPSSG